MKRNLMDFIIVIMIVSYDYLRMLGMNNKIVLIGYLFLDLQGHHFFWHLVLTKI